MLLSRDDLRAIPRRAIRSRSTTSRVEPFAPSSGPVGHRVGADRRRARRSSPSSRSTPPSRAGAPHRLHDAAQGALQPEVRRLLPGSSAPTTVGILTGDVKVNPHAPVAGHDDRDPPQRALRQRPRRPPLRRPRRVPLHGRRGPRHRVGGDHRQRAATTWRWSALSATVANVSEIADWISIVHRPHRADLPSAPAGAARVRHRRPGRRDPRARRRSAAGARRSSATSPAGRTTAGAGTRGGWSHPTVLHRGAGGAGLAAGHLLHLQPGRLRARDAGRAHRGQEPARGASSSGRSTRRSARLIRESPTVAESALNQSVFEALRLGDRLHHAGILPSLKRLIEVLFERGLCKVVLRDRDDVARHPHAGAAASCSRASPSGPTAASARSRTTS